MRTFRFGSSLPPHSMALSRSSWKACADRLADVFGQVGFEVRHHAVQPVGRLARARHDKLDPVGARRHDLDRRLRPAASSASRTSDTSARGSIGLWTYCCTCWRTARSSVSGVSSDVITTTFGRRFERLRFSSIEHAEAVHARHPHVEQHEVEAARAQPPERLGAVFRHAHVEAGPGEHGPGHVPRRPVVVDDENAGGAALMSARLETGRAGAARPWPAPRERGQRAPEACHLPRECVGQRRRVRPGVAPRGLLEPAAARNARGAPSVPSEPLSACAPRRSASQSPADAACLIADHEPARIGAKDGDELVEQAPIAAQPGEGALDVE